MTDQYLNQYKKETAQIHAPLELIERTKAAVREEEERIRKMDAARLDVPGVPVYRDEKRYTQKSVYKWAYPLTAAAALLILISVSLAMRAMKGSSSGMSGAVYEESADAGFAETTTEECAPTEWTAEEGAALESVAEDAPVEAAAGGAESAEAVEESRGSLSDEGGQPLEEMEQAADMAQDAGDVGAAKKALEEEREMAESLVNSAAASDSIVIEKTETRPDFCDLPDTETHRYEDQRFLVRRENNGWKAYAETEEGAGYVLYGEAEDLEVFLREAYEKLTDVW